MVNEEIKNKDIYVLVKEKDTVEITDWNNEESKFNINVPREVTLVPNSLPDVKMKNEILLPSTSSYGRLIKVSVLLNLWTLFKYILYLYKLYHYLFTIIFIRVYFA